MYCESKKADTMLVSYYKSTDTIHPATQHVAKPRARAKAD